MPIALREWQAAFAARLATGEAGDARLGIHRHHMLSSLSRALGETFATVQALVGPDFFRQLAQAFVAQHLPAQPVLAEYGEAFPEFIAVRENSHGLAYLADVARLDWALNAAFYSRRGIRLAAADLAALPAEQLPSMSLVLAPGTAVVRSRYRLDRIWQASQPGASDQAVDAEQGAVCLLVLRRPDDAGFVALGTGEAAFVSALGGGLSLEEATGAAFAAEAQFDLAGSFGRLIACEVFAAAQHCSG